MKIKLSRIIGVGKMSGEFHYRWKDSHLFAGVDGDDIDKFRDFNDRDIINLPGLTLRIITQRPSRGDVYFDSYFVMKESWLALFLSIYFKMLFKFLPKLFSWEKKWFLITVNEGEPIPPISLSGMLARTIPFVEPFAK